MAALRARHRQRPHRTKKPALDGVMMDGAHPHLWLTEDNQDISFRELMQSVRCKRLTELSIYNILSKFSEEEVHYLYNTVAELPQLRNFSLWASEPLTLPVLTAFLQKGQKLESAAFNCVEICSLEELADFSTTVQHHPNLKRLALDNLQIMVNGIAIDTLLMAVAQNSRLKSLRISTECGDDVISSTDTLASLCQNSNLEELFFWGVDLSDEHVIQMSNALQSANHSNIRTLSLRKCGMELTNRGYEALVKMLQRNFEIKVIYLDPSVDTNIQWRIDFFLHLNQSGTRQTLLENPNSTPEDWFEALAFHRKDLDALFYLLEECGSTIFISNSSNR